MKRFTKKQRAWLLVRLNKIAQLKRDCTECNRDNLRLTAENNALRTSDNAKASRIADLIGQINHLSDRLAEEIAKNAGHTSAPNEEMIADLQAEIVTLTGLAARFEERAIRAESRECDTP